ncbi:Oligoxyloglucan reducing end-specific cellobiohydrolase [Vararia minispora EC-137]|uniref:Oligoxyloglucan reducing end-specific cellobiohydrolase n=1 Tax=Vararia minispora EC-137 TaxID=1314806 RepID=A0ACB8QG20_9AGAM|nr:Oligoxyloglucan reducing end-specific cellobiohydrolase [Vararia minispora EC-137]
MRRHLSLCLWHCALALLSGLLPVLTRAADPTYAVTHFENLPARLVSLDDTQTVVYHDAITRNIFVSQDEGRTWKRPENIPEGVAVMFFEHPFDNRMAFVLTKDKKHYLTNDRGETWRSFEVPISPAFVSRPLSFHSSKEKYGYILYQGTACSREGWGAVCHDETYYTTDAFMTSQKLLSETSQCVFAHSSADFKHQAHENLIFCVAFDGTSPSSGRHSLSSSRLYSSTDFFKTENRLVDLGIGEKHARGVVALAIVSKFAVVALKDLSGSADMLLFVSTDASEWAQAKFPHASQARLRENAYTIVESMTHSLAVDVVLHEQGAVGTLFVSNSNGTWFVESLKDTNRNEMGFVDFETVYGVEGVGIANVVSNAQDVTGRSAPKTLQSRITFDDGSSWTPLRGPDCGGNDEACALHLHSVTLPHNFGRIFSSPAPGLVMGVGSVGAWLKDYEDSDTFLSLDAGVTWQRARQGPHKYEFGDKGSILVLVDDEQPTSKVVYSTDFGRNWNELDIGLTVRARALTTVPDSTSQKFMLVAQVGRSDADGGRYVVVHLDFSPTRTRKCEDDDMEKWYARAKGKECLMGHRQWYWRRKSDKDCYVGNKFQDPVEHEDNCPCEDDDFECDYNYVRNGDQCEPAGPEPIPAGVCEHKTDTYMGSSGWRLIPGNTCNRDKGKNKDVQKQKSCEKAQPADGSVIHQTFEFPALIRQHAYFRDSTTILVHLADDTIWLSNNEGYTWRQVLPDSGHKFLAFYHHSFSNDRAYLITNTKDFFYTTDAGRSWNKLQAPTVPNTFRALVLRFHPEHSDYLIWVGDQGCENFGPTCRAVAHYSTNNGRRWDFIDDYVRNCAWARDSAFRVDPSEILCESHQTKGGNQRMFNDLINPLELWAGPAFFDKKKRKREFDSVVGFTKFSQYLIVAEYLPQSNSLELQVSLDGINFAQGQFPPSMKPSTQQAYTILESSTDSVFMHMTTSIEPPWGTILKSNSNGTYFGSSITHVNRNERGYVDFEKMIGLDGVVLINVVTNYDTAPVSGAKALQTRISHNDGGSWKPLTPPPKDSNGEPYSCQSVECTLNVHGYTERTDPRATFSTPSVVGLIMAVGNVGDKLAPYKDSDTFLSRDAGFTWEEVHKDAHLWEFGDSGSILVMANDEGPTDTVLYTLDEGLTWKEYRFSDEKMRVNTIVTVPSDTSRRFILLGTRARSQGTTVVHLDFSALTNRQCGSPFPLLNADPNLDDFELWSPSEERSEQCLFGRQTVFHRRKRTSQCFVGNQEKYKEKIERNCICTPADFECEFNYERNTNGECVLVPGTQSLPNDEICSGDDEYWYERTPYRRIPHSTCDGGNRPDRGKTHECPGLRGHGTLFWMFIIAIPFAFCSLVGWWWYRKSGMATGTIRLPSGGVDTTSRFRSNATFMDTLASVPWFVVGMVGIAYERVADAVSGWTARFRHRTGYRNVPVDDDAQVLRFEDEDE